MKARMTAGKLLRAAGVLTWAAVTAFALYLAARGGNAMQSAVPTAALLAALNLGAMLVVIRCGQRRDWVVYGALFVQLATALAVGWVLPISFVPIYTIIWIGMTANFFSLRECAALLVGVMLGWYLIMRFEWGEDSVVISIVLYGTFHLFALLSARNAAEAEAAREEVETLNRELLATQHLLAEASRQRERSRIARDLHDLLGHHLTALSINLQIAERLTEGEAHAKVGESRALARLLLSDVREAVSELRTDDGVDIGRAVELLAQNVPQLSVEAEVQPDLGVDDVTVAESLVRCIQEAVTNTLRHADAEKIWIRLWREDGQIRLQVRDDGAVAGKLSEGNGLAGMRERLADLDGSLALDRCAGALQLNVAIPVRG